MDKATRCARRFALDWLLVVAFVLLCVLLSLVTEGGPSMFFALVWRVFLFCYAVARAVWAVSVLRADVDDDAAPAPAPAKPGIMSWVMSFVFAVLIVCVIVSFSGHFKRSPVRLARDNNDAFDALFSGADPEEDDASAASGDSSAVSDDSVSDAAAGDVFVVNPAN